MRQLETKTCLISDLSYGDCFLYDELSLNLNIVSSIFVIWRQSLNEAFCRRIGSITKDGSLCLFSEYQDHVPDATKIASDTQVEAITSVVNIPDLDGEHIVKQLMPNDMFTVPDLGTVFIVVKKTVDGNVFVSEIGTLVKTENTLRIASANATLRYALSPEFFAMHPIRRIDLSYGSTNGV